MEIKEEAMNVVEEATTNDVTAEGSTAKKVIKASAIALTIGAIGVFIKILVDKNKRKIDERKTKREVEDLKKKGYTILEPFETSFDEAVEKTEVDSIEE